MQVEDINYFYTFYDILFLLRTPMILIVFVNYTCDLRIRGNVADTYWAIWRDLFKASSKCKGVSISLYQKYRWPIYSSTQTRRKFWIHIAYRFFAHNRWKNLNGLLHSDMKMTEDEAATGSRTVQSDCMRGIYIMNLAAYALFWYSQSCIDWFVPSFQYIKIIRHYMRDIKQPSRHCTHVVICICPVYLTLILQSMCSLFSLVNLIISIHHKIAIKWKMVRLGV